MAADLVPLKRCDLFKRPLLTAQSRDRRSDNVARLIRSHCHLQDEVEQRRKGSVLATRAVVMASDDGSVGLGHVNRD